MADFYAARSGTIPPLPWTNFAPPLSFYSYFNYGMIYGDSKSKLTVRLGSSADTQMSDAFMRNPIDYPRPLKKAGFLLFDWALLPICLLLAFSLRLGFTDPQGPFGLRTPLSEIEPVELIAILAASSGVIYIARLYRIRLHSFDLDSIARLASTAAVLIAIASISSYFLKAPIPRTSAVYYGLLFFAFSTAGRVIPLMSLNYLRLSSVSRTPIAIYGAGLAGIQLATSLKRSLEVRPVLFVDDNPALQNLLVSGLHVYSPSKLTHFAESGRIREVLIGTSLLSRAKRIALEESMSLFGCAVKVIPSYVDLISGRATVNDLRSVVPDQLLGREKIDLDVPQISKAYSNRNILVTGAGGSIGSELCRQLSDCQPQKIVLFERSEFALYSIEKELKDLMAEFGIPVVAKLGSVIDESAVRDVIESEEIDVILHAAAYKHVPLIECNEVEGARNNVLGTKVVAEAAASAGVERFILVSTDKAVRPTNIMGATKRLAELVVGNLQAQSVSTCFSIVRFGNVLGSSGSVVPLFQSQITMGGPVTVTHQDVTRYFMTIPEAARLVLLAGAYSQGGDLFLLDMGEPIKIMDLAQRMIELSGRTVRNVENPDGDIAIEITGLRPGEKLYEELLIDEENLTDTPHEKILRANFEGLSGIAIEEMLDRINEGIVLRDRQIIREVIKKYV
ncbi:polysaccharide biosynthesis protein [Marinobacter sp.]|uniref:polysaccharide biosynthesis protein n=1 Tax=Marinobacter sp. TaxID=50741 RepID=UPI003A958CC2